MAIGPTTLDPTQLAAQARAAYEQKRTRDCLAVLKALALADPGNAEAASLQSAIRADIQRDLDDARGLIQESAGDGEKKKYRKAAEIILRKTLNIDPENEQAKSLLQSIRSMAETPMNSHAQPPMGSHPQPHVDSRPTPHQAAYPAPERKEEIEFVAAPALERHEKSEKKRGRLKLPMAIVAIVAVGGGLLLRQQSSPTETNAMASVTQPEPVNDSGFNPRLPEAQNTAVPVPSPIAPVATKPLSATDQTQPTAMPSVNTAASMAPTAPLTPVPVPNAMGKLAISSPIAAEIYANGRYLGSTPITLELPAGRQTLEYRHGTLRTVVNHDVKADRTTSASVTFRVTVQINARPWAQVSVDGNSRQSLGQTPLSGVTVPIGGVLIFENPNFTSKSYRVTEKDTAIQVDFP